MSDSNRAPISDIDRAMLGLTDSAPVRYISSTHPATGGTLRDMHWEFELGVVRQGSMRREAQGWSAELASGMVWMCGSWEPHGYQITAAPCTVGVLVVSPLWLARLSEDLGDTMRLHAPFSAAPFSRPQMPQAHRRAAIEILEELDAHATDTAWVSVAVQRLILLCCHEWQAPANARVAASPFTRIAPALNMGLESRAFVPVEDAAAACGLSRNAFSTHFRSATGIGFAEFALRRRLRGAALALAHGTQPVKAIAYDWGFSNPSHLVRAFHHHYGFSPAQYRVRSCAPDRFTDDRG